MSEEMMVKKRGRPRKNPLPPATDGNAGEMKKRPLCEKSELAKYPPDGIVVTWGIQPECKHFKRKGLAVLFNPENKGGMVTLMPVTDDDGGELRWRYRFISGYAPFRYEKIDLEPGQAASVPKILREVADTIETGISKWFGGQKEADATTTAFHKEVKAEAKKDALGDKIRKYGI